VERRHWTDTLFVAYGIFGALVLGLLVGELIFGAVSPPAFLGVCLASVISFLAAAGFKGSLLVGTTSQKLVGSLTGIVLIGGCLWTVHWLAVAIAFFGFKVPGELLIALTALVGFLGATRADATGTASGS
jgi:hypothetical protein